MCKCWIPPFIFRPHVAVGLDRAAKYVQYPTDKTGDIDGVTASGALTNPH